MSSALDIRKEIQRLLHVTDDGIWGPKTMDAISAVAHSDAPEWPIPAPPEGTHEVKASSFADPADVHAFQLCRAQGNSEQFCFKKGDNGLGFGKYDCTENSGPACALPPEDWSQFPDARQGKRKVNIRRGELAVVAEMRDTMPHRQNITNGAGIDLNPDACAALGISIPADVKTTHVTWEWVDPS